MLIMAGILGRLFRSQKKVVLDSKVLELETAKEILAEVFRASPSDVEDMIQKRLSNESLPGEESRPEEIELWPEMFWVRR